jgi:hypothetical protein
MLNDVNKFSGECELEIVNGVSRFFDGVVIGCDPVVENKISFRWEIVDYIQDDLTFKSLGDGKYHVYFDGTYDIEDEFSVEWGKETKFVVHVKYINFCWLE